MFCPLFLLVGVVFPCARQPLGTLHVLAIAKNCAKTAWRPKLLHSGVGYPCKTHTKGLNSSRPLWSSLELTDAVGTEGRTELAMRRSLARRREMWLTWSTSPSENARRQSLSVSVTSGGAVVQQEDPDHTAAQWSRTGLPSSPNCCQVAARPHASESGTNTD